MEKENFDPTYESGREPAWQSGSAGNAGYGARAATQTEAGVAEQANEIAARAQEKAGEFGEMAQEKAGEVASMAQERADVGIDRAAEGLQQAADTMRERAGDHDGMQAQVGTKLADGLEKTAAYLKEHDSAELWDEVEAFVKEHPMQAAAGALVAGFLFGRILR